MPIFKIFSVRKFCYVFSFFAIASVVQSPSVVYAQDADGCFSTSSNCVYSTGEWNGEKFISRHVNNCSGRIWIKICNKFKSGNEDCGLSGLKQGNTKTWVTYGGASGKYTTTWIGSTIPNKDAVCGLKAGV